MTEWSTSVVNMTVVSLTVIFAIFYMNQFLGLLPYLADGVLRWRPLVSLEDSVRLFFLIDGSLDVDMPCIRAP